jgi:outer membrane lipoprotein-sorting protein
MGTSKRAIRGLLALGLAVGLVAAACTSSSAPNVPGGGNGLPGAGGTGSLSSGLSGNLATLDSYQFSWSFSTSSSGATAAETGSFKTTGTVVNKPTKAYKINDLGMFQIIVIGDKGWMSSDNGSTWLADDTYKVGSSSLDGLLPDSMYASDFDSNAGGFTVAGSETKNGIDCFHYTGASSLGALGAIAGANATVKQDLWVSKAGNFPVSGFYGYSASSGGQTGSFGYSFDVTNVNDAANNKVEAPTNVVALPSF